MKLLKQSHNRLERDKKRNLVENNIFRACKNDK